MLGYDAGAEELCCCCVIAIATIYHPEKALSLPICSAVSASAPHKAVAFTNQFRFADSDNSLIWWIIVSQREVQGFCLGFRVVEASVQQHEIVIVGTRIRGGL